MMLAFCGNDCAYCPRYIATQKNDAEELQKVAELWHAYGMRDRVVSCEEIKCSGCTETSPCRYGVASCAGGKSVALCGTCASFEECKKISNMLKRTDKFAEKVRSIVTAKEFTPLKKAFFSKKENLEHAKKK